MRRLLFFLTNNVNISLLVDQGIVSAANFVTGLLIGRICSKEQFGLYMLGFTIITFVINFQGALITTPYTIFIPRLEGVVRSQYTGSTLVHQLGLSILVVLFLAITGAFLSLGLGPTGLLSVINSLIFTITFILLWDYARHVCLATVKIRAVLVLDSCVAFLQIGGLLLLAYLGLLSAAHAYWAISIACGIATLSLLISLRREFAVRFAQTMSDFKVNFSTGWWIFASGMLWTFKTSLYPWLLAGFHGTVSTGVWAACVGIVALCNPLLLGLQNSFGPKIAHAYTVEEMEGFRRFSLQTATLFGGLIAPFCVVFILFGGPLLTGIYGSKYTGNGFIVSILALNLLISAPAVPLSRALFTIGRADIDFKINLITLLCTLSVGIFLVKAYGIIGAAYGLLLSNVMCFVFKYISIRRLDYSKKGKYPLEPEKLVNKTMGVE